ncbi:MAG: hypothetical protein FJY29_10595 [Betaproteobacteria bacterium]|nr:hypothetical protein [Betaproteobacteria bacterium]
MPRSPRKKCTEASQWPRALALAVAWPVLTLISSQAASAHPVVFEQGTAIMGHHQGDMAGLEIIHSPRWWCGLGIVGERTKNSSVLLARANALVWRGNFPDLQSNLYIGLAGGMGWGALDGHTHGDQSTQRNLALAKERSRHSRVQGWSVEADAEDRQYYGKARFKQMFKNEQAFSNQTVTRLGYAPYKAQADEPALWAMVEWSVQSDSKFNNQEHEITPLVRYFYRNMLFEVGSSLNGRLAFNYMIHSY